jgi:hypothetical protein
MIDSHDSFSPETDRGAPELRQVLEFIQQAQKLAFSCGFIMEVVSRNDVEEVWQARQAESSVNQSFTNEMWEKFRDTYAWRKGLSLVMWDGVWEMIGDGLNDIEDPSFGRIV